MADRSALVLDTNICIEHALRLAQDGVKVYYCPASGSAYPILQDLISGDGFNLLPVEDMGQYIFDVDLVLISDCFLGGFADSLRDQGVNVFGASRKWAFYENDRAAGFKALKKMGVGVPDSEVCIGLKQVLAYIDSHEDKSEKDPAKKERFFIKCNKYRGNFETRAVRTSQEAESFISQSNFGPYLQDLVYLIQRQSPGVEIGVDVFFNGKDFLKPMAFTIEQKGEGNVTKWVEKNGVDTFILDKIKKSLIDSEYKGNVSFEFLYDGQETRVIDITSRLPFPCSVLQAKYIENYADVVFSTAMGEDVEVRIIDDYDFCTSITISTSDIITWRPIVFPKNLRDSIGFRRVVFKDGMYYFVPGDEVVCTTSAQGDSYDDSIERAVDIAKQVECNNITFSGNFSDEIDKIVEKLNSLGDDFSF